MQLILFTPFLVSFLVTILCTPYWIRRARRAELVGRDMHKLDRRFVAEIGGVPVLVGFLAGAFTYTAIVTFTLHMPDENYRTFAMLTTVLIASMIGLIDDILGWKIGLRQWQKPVLTLFAALPMVVVNAGSSEIGVPWGTVELSYVYLLFVVPVGIIGATNGFNMIGGYNGLEAGMGALILTTLGLISYLGGKTWITILAFCMVTAILAFLLFNWYPARIFPGNMFTYFTGALIACIAVFGNSEKIALVLFIPYFFELLLKARGLMQKESFAKLLPDGSLDKPYEKWYGIEHIALSLLKMIRGKVYEKDIVILLLCCELVLCLFAGAIVYFKLGLI